MRLQGLDVGQILEARISHPYGHLMANFSTSLNHFNFLVRGKFPNWT